MTSRLGDDSGHVLALGLSTLERTELLLGELAGTLLLGVSDQLNNASLVRSQSAHLTGQVSDELSSLGEGTLAVGGLSSNLSGGDLVSLVETNGDSSLLGGHFSMCR